MTSRKELMLEIANLEKELLSQKIERNQHKHYVSNFIEENKVILLALLVPVFVIGWKNTKKKPIRQIGKQVSNLVMLTAVASVRKKLWQSFAKLFSL